MTTSRKPLRNGPGYSPGRPAPPQRPHLSFQLKPGWRHDAAAQAFVGPRGARIDYLARLPSGSAVVPAAPALDGRDPASLSAAELALTRYVQLLLPAGTDVDAALATVRRWSCVAEAQRPGDVALP